MSTWKLWEQKPEGNRWGLSTIKITPINDIFFPSRFQLIWLAVIKVNVASWRTSSLMWSTWSSWGSRIFPHNLIAYHVVESFLFIFTSRAKSQCQKINICLVKRQKRSNITSLTYSLPKYLKGDTLCLFLHHNTHMTWSQQLYSYNTFSFMKFY